jgi:hypothetical protein
MLGADEATAAKMITMANIPELMETPYPKKH